MLDIVIDALDRAIWKESLIAGAPAQLYPKRIQPFISVFSSRVERFSIPVEQVFLQPGGPVISGRSGGYLMPWVYQSVNGGRYHLHSCEKPSHTDDALSAFDEGNMRALVHSFVPDHDKLQAEAERCRWVLLNGLDDDIAHASVGSDPIPAVFSGRFTIAMIEHGKSIPSGGAVVIHDVLPILMELTRGQSHTIQALPVVRNQDNNQGLSFV